MRFSWLVLCSVAGFVACGGSAFTGQGNAQAGSGGASADAGTSASAGRPVLPEAGRAGAAAGESSGGVPGGGAPAAGAPAAGAPAAGAPAGGSSGSGSSGSGGALPATRCPAAPPVVGQPCTAGLACSYGDDPRPACRTRYGCSMTNKWASPSVPSAATCAPIADCSMTPSGFPVVNHECKTIGEECTFDGMASGTIYCRCNFCGASASCPASMASWACAGPPVAPCPEALPNEGQPCEKKQSCFYGVPCEGASMVCDGKTWSLMGGGCAN